MAKTRAEIQRAYRIRKKAEKDDAPNDEGERAFPEAARPSPEASFAAREAEWRQAVAMLPLALRLTVYPDTDPRHRVEVDAWWRHSQDLRAALHGWT